ncbi:MAG TPA: hypothetical protein VK137_19700, partial [Planctomycetaceae bacterium]|nr:hypothetical protein [Planctomycetaceae bacterium]
MRRLLVPRGLWLVVLSISWLSVTVAQAAEPADAIPDSASVVLRLKAPQGALGRLGDYVNAVQPGVGEALKGNLPALGLLISNPALTGVDVEKDWWAIVFAESRQKPEVVFVVPTTDAVAMKNVLPPGFQFHAADKLAIYSESDEALGKVRDRLSGKGTALLAKLDASSKKLFDDSDVSALIHLRQLAKAFDDEFQQAEPKLDALLNQLSALSPEPQRQQLAMVLDMYRVLGKAAVQGARDSNSLTLGVTFSKDAIRFEDRLQVAEGTATAKFLSSQPTGNLALLSRLPANKLAYFGVKADMAGMVDWSMTMTKGWITNATDEQKAQFDDALKLMRSLKWGEMAAYFDIDPSATDGAMRAASAAEITPTNRLREISRTMFKAMGEIQTPGLKQTIKLEPAVERIGGIEADRLTMKQEVDPAIDPLGIQ